MKTKKTIGLVLTTLAVVLMTTTFGFAESLATLESNFPYFQFGCLVVGGLILVSLKKRFEKIYTVEAIGTFALYTLLISLFTNPVIDIIKEIVS